MGCAGAILALPILAALLLFMWSLLSVWLPGWLSVLVLVAILVPICQHQWEKEKQRVVLKRRQERLNRLAAQEELTLEAQEAAARQPEPDPEPEPPPKPPRREGVRDAYTFDDGKEDR